MDVFFFQAEDGIRDGHVTGVQTCALPISNFSEPAQTSAEYSPRLWPATKSGCKPFSASTRVTATEQVRMAGWVLAVSLRSSSLPSKQSLEIEKPSVLSASSKTALAAAYFSASSLPMPGYCEACPGNTNATLPMAVSSGATVTREPQRRRAPVRFFR